jgi:hypothetical protein
MYRLFQSISHLFCVLIDILSQIRVRCSIVFRQFKLWSAEALAHVRVGTHSGRQALYQGSLLIVCDRFSDCNPILLTQGMVSGPCSVQARTQLFSQS